MNMRIIIPVIAVIIIIVAVVAFPSTVFSPEYNMAENPQTAQPSEPEEPEFDKEAKSIDDPASLWVIVSKVSPLEPLNYAPTDLVDVGNGHQLRREAAEAYQKMVTDARKVGHEIVPLSGYRAYETQQVVYANEVQMYGQETADSQSARPGYSEHQTGLGIDVGGGGCGIEDCFGETAEYQWLRKNAHKYGFIQRYTNGSQDITGYRTEPWHWRFVGKDLAVEMNRQNIQTLEEFFDVIPESQPW